MISAIPLGAPFPPVFCLVNGNEILWVKQKSKLKSDSWGNDGKKKEGRRVGIKEGRKEEGNQFQNYTLDQEVQNNS